MTDDKTAKEMFLQLRALIKKEQYPQCVEECDQILAVIPGDIDALRVKVSSLIAQDKIDEALSVCRDVNELEFEKAYCLYRLNKLDDAVQVCSAVKHPKSENVINLEAQTKYNLSVERYDSITAQTESLDDLDIDLLSNVYAAYTSAGRGQEVLDRYHVDDEVVGDGFELLFNTVCALISAGHITQAATALERTESLCRDVLTEDGLTEQEIGHEITKIQLQKSFVDILSNRKSNESRQTAVHECLSILRSNSSGGKNSKNYEMLAVAANNLAVLRGDKDLPDSLRRLRTTITAEAEEKLSLNQLMEIRYNRCILLLHMKKIDDTFRALDDLDRIYGNTIQSVVIRAAIAASAGNYKASDDILLGEQRRLEVLGGGEAVASVEKLLVVYIQTLIARRQYSDAMICLESIKSLKHTPAGVSAMYYLKILAAAAGGGDGSGGGSSGRDVVERVAGEYLLDVARKLDGCADSEYRAADGTQTLLFIAGVLDSHQLYGASAEVLQIVLRCGSDELDTSDRLVVSAHLVVALSYSDPSGAERFASSLPQVEINEDINAAELETKDIPRILKNRVNATTAGGGSAASKSTQEDEKLKAIEARKRRRSIARKVARKAAYLQKLAAEGKYDPAKPTKPDPERWIPLKQRSYSKRGRKNRNKFVGGQGSGDGAQKDMLKLDVFARTQLAAEKPVSTGTVISSDSTNKKKKGKGKKK